MKEPDSQGKPISDRRIQTVSLMVLAAIAGVFSVYWLRPVLVPFILACFIVSGVGPLLSHVESRIGVSRLSAAAMTFLFCLALLGAFGLTLFASIVDLYSNSGDYLERVRRLTAMVEDNIPVGLIVPGSKRDPDVDEATPAELTPKGTSAVPADDSDPTPAVAEAALTPLAAEQTPSQPATAEDSASRVDSAAVIDVEANPPIETTADDVPAAGTEETDPSPDTADPTTYNDAIVSEKLPALTIAARNAGELRPPSPDELAGQRRKVPPVVDTFVRQGIAIVSQALINLVSTSVVVLIYVFFLLLGKPTYATTGTVREIDTQIRSYLSLKTVISLATGGVFGATLWLFGVPMALSFGVLAFLLNFIPNIGPIVASILPVPLVVLDPSGNVLWMISVIVATCSIQLISGNVVEPKLMGNSSDLHPVTILLALMFWGMMWGIIGMFLATPITAAIKIVMERFEPTRQVAELMAGRWQEPSSVGDDGDRRPAAAPLSESFPDGIV